MFKWLLILCVFMIICAYFVGGVVATKKCKTEIMKSNFDNQSLIIKTMENVDEKVSNTGVLDIRRVLREHYTITN